MSNTPTTSSTTLSAEELQAVKWSKAYWTGNSGWTPLPTDHPCYEEACFHCHQLGHIRINCQFYTCPTCLYNAPDQIQNHCPLHHQLNPVHTTSSSSSSSNQSNSSARSIHPIPHPLADQLSSSPPHCTFQRSCHNQTIMACIHASTVLVCNICPPTLKTNDDDVYNTDTWRNINGD